MHATSSSVHDQFLTDHRRIEELLTSTLAAFEANDREDIQRLWTAFESSLRAHLEAEEKFMIPQLERARKQDAEAILADHARIRAQVAELGTGIDIHVVRLETARAFVDDLRAHSQREESLYAWADDHLAEQDRSSLLGAVAHAVRAVFRDEA
jgi:hemerythrin